MRGKERRARCQLGLLSRIQSQVAVYFPLIRLEGRSDNFLVEHSKQTRRLWFWFWVLVVAVAAWFWPGFQVVRLH